MLSATALGKTTSIFKNNLIILDSQYFTNLTKVLERLERILIRQ